MFIAEYFLKGDKESRLPEKIENFDLNINDDTRIGEIVKQLYKKFEIITFVHYTDGRPNNLLSNINPHIQFCFETKNYFVSIHHDIQFTKFNHKEK